MEKMKRLFYLRYTPGQGKLGLDAGEPPMSVEEVCALLVVLPVLMKQSLSDFCRAFTYVVHFDERDSLYIARVEEFSFLAARGDTPAKAIEKIFLATEIAVKERVARGEPVPKPIR